MDILCENNALLNIRKCLETDCIYYEKIFGKDDCHHQIEDLLQFCIQIVFYEKIHIAGNASTSILAKSDALIRDLKQYNIKNVFSIKHFGGEDASVENLASAEQALIDAIVNDEDDPIGDSLKACYLPQNYTLDLLWNFFPPLIKDEKDMILAATDAIIREDTRSLGITSKVISCRKDGGIFKLFGDERVSQRIIDSAKENKTSWKLEMTLLLMVKFRSLLNQVLAKQNGQMLAPSVIRARAVANERRIFDEKQIFDKIDEIFRTIDELPYINDIIRSNMSILSNIGSVTMPSLKQYLINKSKGDVEGILIEAAELRKKFSCVRDYIRYKKESSTGQNWWKGLDEIAQGVVATIPELSHRDTRQVSQGSLVIALPTISPEIPLTASVSMPIPKLPRPHFLQTWQEKRLKASVNAFTEIVFDEHRLKNKDKATQSLIRNCGTYSPE